MNRKRGQGREEGGRGKLFLREREREGGREMDRFNQRSGMNEAFGRRGGGCK